MIFLIAGVLLAVGLAIFYYLWQRAIDIGARETAKNAALNYG